jgi:hypothetical protein
MANGHEEEGLRWAELVVRERPDHAPTNRLLADYFDRRGQSGLANYYRLHASPSRRPASRPRRPWRRTDPPAQSAPRSR